MSGPLGADPAGLSVLQAALADDAAWLQQLQAATTAGDRPQLHQLAGLAAPADPTGAGAPR